MTNDLEIKPDLTEHNEQNEKSSNNIDNLSDSSLYSSPELEPAKEEDEIQNNDVHSPEVHDQIDEILHINENNKEEDDLTRFILQAQQQNFNCLDLSKKHIIEFPPTLLEFPSLQVILF